MKTRFWFMSVLVVTVLAATNVLHAAVTQTTSLAKFGEAATALQEKTPLKDHFIDGSEAVLTRHSDTVEMNINARELTPNAAYTVWWVFFNHPEHCAELCDPGELRTEEIKAAVFYATGGVADADGNATFNTTLGVGEFPESDDQILIDGSDRSGMMDTMTTVVHLVLRTHGLVIDGMVEEQITTANGGCPPNDCANEQAAIFEVPSATAVESIGKLAVTWGDLKKN